jgi:hypothetical protein
MIEVEIMRSNVKQNPYFAACFWIALLLPSISYGASPEEEVVSKIREIYVQTSQLVENKKTEVIILRSEAGKDGYDIKKWHLADDKQNYETGAYEARVFIVDRNVLKTRVVIQSLSGDWADVIEYYYYQNGKLAFIFEGNTTYNGYIVKNNKKDEPDGPFVIEKRSYFSEDGKRVRFLEKAYLKKTSEAVPITQIQDINIDKYGAVCSLPFISLIQDKVKACKK